MERKAKVMQHGIHAGTLEELEGGRTYCFTYEPEYRGGPVSLAMPVRRESYFFDNFPPAFEGLLPEGIQLEALLRQRKIDRNDLMGQILAVGEDVVGSLSIVAE